MKAKAANIPLNQLDFNLLLDFDTLLREGSVVGAARKLHVSSPAMSRRLTRLREAMGDPLFVPAGRGLVPTERALALRDRVQQAIDSVRSVFTPDAVNFKKLDRTFTVRANDGFAGAFATQLVEALKKEAPGVCLKLIPRTEINVDMLRSGLVDLDLGVIEDQRPEIQSDPLFEAKFVGVVREHHPMFKSGSKKGITTEALVAWDHISTSPRGQGSGRLDAALKKQGLQRRIGIIAPGFQAALVMASGSDYIAVMPEQFARWAKKYLPLKIFALPVETANVEVSQSWHARHNLDPVHQWLRMHVRKFCAR